MDSELEIISLMYQEQRAQVRHHETQRATVSNILITITVATIALIAHMKFALYSLPLSLFLVFIGVYGCLISLKLYERSCLHMLRSSLYRKRLDKMFPKAGILECKYSSDNKHCVRFPRIISKWIRLYHLWIALYILIVILGLACTYITIGK